MLVGANTMTRIGIGGAPALLLGPLTVEEAFRARGIGETLAQKSLRRRAKPPGMASSSSSATRRFTNVSVFRARRSASSSFPVRSIRRGFYCDLQPGALENFRGAVTLPSRDDLHPGAPPCAALPRPRRRPGAEQRQQPEQPTASGVNLMP